MSEPRRDRCPVCGADNDCAVVRCGAAAGKDCWCARITIPGDALARIPAAATGAACLCRSCAAGAGLPAQEVGRARD